MFFFYLFVLFFLVEFICCPVHTKLLFLVFLLPVYSFKIKSGFLFDGLCFGVFISFGSTLVFILYCKGIFFLGSNALLNVHHSLVAYHLFLDLLFAIGMLFQ